MDIWSKLYIISNGEKCFMSIKTTDYTVREIDSYVALHRMRADCTNTIYSKQLTSSVLQAVRK
jgi:hypothetical protein